MTYDLIMVQVWYKVQMAIPGKGNDFNKLSSQGQILKEIFHL